MTATAIRLSPSPPTRLRGTPPSELSARELEITRLIATGLGTKEVAVRLGLAIPTVETHRHNIYAKLRVGSVVLLAHWALARGIVVNRFQGGEFYGS